MAELDPSIILAGRPVQLADQSELQAKAYKLRDLAMQSQAAQQDYQDRQALRDIYKQSVGQDGSLDTGKFSQLALGAGLGQQAGAAQATALERQKTQADIGQTQAKTGLDTAQAGKTNLDAAYEKAQHFGDSLHSLLSKPNLSQTDVIGAINDSVNKGYIDPQTGAQWARNLPGDPNQMRALLIQQANATQSTAQQIAQQIQQAPQLEKIDQGNKISLAQRDPLTGQVTMGQSVAKGVSPDTSANIAKDLKVQQMQSGMSADGTLDPASEHMAQMMAKGQMVPSDRMETNARGLNILDRVQQLNPNFDIGQAKAKVKATQEFTTGQSAAQLQSIGTASKHLDMLGGMVDALHNGNLPAINKLAQAYAQQTGSTAPTTFDAAKQIVGQEVVKAIVAGGGGEGEREAAAASLNKASTPAQLKQVIQTYRTIMGAQRESLMQRAKTAGVPESSIPDYAEGQPGTAAVGGAAAHPADIQAILNKYK